LPPERSRARVVTYDPVASSPAVDDASLVSRLRAGEAPALETLVRTRAPQLLMLACRFLRDKGEAQGVVQEVFLAALESIHGLEERSLVDPWLHRLVVEASVGRLKIRRPGGAIEELLPRFLEDGHHVARPSAWRQPTEALMERPDSRGFFRTCIDRLPEIHRTVLLLRDTESLDAAGTARLLGIEEAAVKTCLHQARQALVALLDAQLGGGES
jgi:RNA polymerase sigma-70 factor, ECF subfamily